MMNSKTWQKGRNILLALVMAGVGAVSWSVSRMQPGAQMVSLPVTLVQGEQLSPVEAYRQRREETTLRNMAALEQLCASGQVEDGLRQDAARLLQHMVKCRQQQLDLEAALLFSGYAPCVAVVEEGCVTIVTQAAQVAEKDRRMLLAVVQEQTGQGAECVRVICAGGQE